MDAQAAELTVRTYLTEVRNRLDKAAGIARAADACAGAGFCDKGSRLRSISSNRLRGHHPPECRQSHQSHRQGELTFNPPGSRPARALRRCEVGVVR